MRRIGAILFSLIMLIMVAAPIANAADFGVTSTSPKDKAPSSVSNKDFKTS